MPGLTGSSLSCTFLRGTFESAMMRDTPAIFARALVRVVVSAEGDRFGTSFLPREKSVRPIINGSPKRKHRSFRKCRPTVPTESPGRLTGAKVAHAASPANAIGRTIPYRSVDGIVARLI